MHIWHLSWHTERETTQQAHQPEGEGMHQEISFMHTERRERHLRERKSEMGRNALHSTRHMCVYLQCSNILRSQEKEGKVMEDKKERVGKGHSEKRTQFPLHFLCSVASLYVHRSFYHTNSSKVKHRQNAIK